MQITWGLEGSAPEQWGLALVREWQGGPGRIGISSPAQPYGFVILLLPKQEWDVPTQSL